jgi:hypothetical protein
MNEPNLLRSNTWIAGQPLCLQLLKLWDTICNLIQPVRKVLSDMSKTRVPERSIILSDLVAGDSKSRL